MSVKTNQERIKEYLVGNKEKDRIGYLKSDLSNGKVIMLSGKWGSGKTHFWQNYIANDELKKELNKKDSAYSYISLYGKSSIEEIENDIFTQIYFSAIRGDNLATKTFSTFTKYSKRYGKLLPSFDLSKLADGLKEEQEDNKERIALERLKNGAIICFDDFERKSKDIDLNDLFGFITQLTLNFKCKVVIILNDDVFEGEEKAIFTNVKEKTVSKFLKYEPSIEELFNSIFENDKEYRKLDEHKEIILKTIEETKELNARIYFQVLDNLLEWVNNKQEKDDDVLRCLILVNINFILYHKIINTYNKKYWDGDENIKSYNIKGLLKNNNLESQFYYLKKNRDTYTREGIINELISGESNRKLDGYSQSKIDDNINLIRENIGELKSVFFAILFNFDSNISKNMLEQINTFIETGILINE